LGYKTGIAQVQATCLEVKLQSWTKSFWPI